MDPQIKIRTANLSRKRIECPTCGTVSGRHGMGHRWIRDIGVNQPVIIEITYSKHFCGKCEKHFNIPMTNIAPQGSNFTNRVRRTAIDLVVKQGLTLEKAKAYMKERCHVLIPVSTIHGWISTDIGV